MNEAQAIAVIGNKIKQEGGFTRSASQMGVTRHAIMNALNGRQNVLPRYLLAWAGIEIEVKTTYRRVKSETV